MKTNEHIINSRVITLQGEVTINKAFAYNNAEMKIDDRRCLYVARVELADENHPILTENIASLTITDTHKNLEFQKRPVRQWNGRVLTFEELINGAAIYSRAGNNDYGAKFNLVNDLSEVIIGQRFNVNAKIYSEFPFYHNEFGTQTDELRTYGPVIGTMLKDISDNL